MDRPSGSTARTGPEKACGKIAQSAPGEPGMDRRDSAPRFTDAISKPLISRLFLPNRGFIRAAGKRCSGGPRKAILSE